MGSFSYEIDASVLRRTAELLGQEGDATLQELGERITADAQSRCPVSAEGSNGNPPGFLRDSIHAEADGSGVVEVVADAPYALFVEAGTRYMPARPFLVPAVDAAQESFPDLVGQALEAAAGKAGATG